MSLPEIEDNKIPGGGVFRRYDSSLVLTAQGQPNRSLWLLPNSFCAKDQHTMSYHGEQKRWQLCDAGYLLQTVGRGQEFILETKDYPGIISWAGSLFKTPGNCY
jgi:Nucleotide modification associated domain 3